MDRIIFQMQNHMESANVNFQATYSNLGNNMSYIKQRSIDSISSSFNAMKHQNLVIKCKNLALSMKETWISFKVVDIYDRCVFFLLTEVTNTHIYFGGMCFILGTLIGIGLGIRIRDSVVAPMKMRAVVTNNYRGLESINVVEDMIAPRIVNPDQVLVQVKAVGIEYVDIKIAEGYGRVMRRHLNKYNPNSWGELPVVLGRNCSGVVVSVGMNVTKFQQGDEVWLAVPIDHLGTLSEYIVVSEKFVALKPSQLSHEFAAVLPYDLMKVWHALVNQSGLDELSTAGKRVLIHAGATGPGLIAIQLVRAWGGHVTTTVRSNAQPLVHMLGADDVITYDTCNFENELLVRDKFDVIFNPIGGALSELALLEFCLPGGTVVTSTDPKYSSDSYGFFLGILHSAFMRMKYLFVKTPWVTGAKSTSIEISGDVLDKAAPFVASGQLQPIVDKAYSAQDSEVAFHHITEGEMMGKTVLRFRARPITSRSNCSF